MQQEELIDRFRIHYGKLISEFYKNICHLDYRGMPEPHIPIIGSCYSKCKYKIAFYGIETAWWHDMEEFMKIAKENPEGAATLHFDDIENMNCLGWKNKPHTSFWDFLFTFIATFYHVDVKNVRNGDYPDLIHSIIWGNTNSIEKYDDGLQAAKNDVPKDVYLEIKKQSRIFDNSDHLINVAKPNVVIVLNWSENESWFINNKTDGYYYKINDHLYYYYKRNTQTHIFQTHHPRSIALRFGFAEIVNELIENIIRCNIWDTLPNSIDEMFEPEIQKGNSELRNELIANIAGGLIKTHSCMCGQQLVDILNDNGITQNNGEPYSHGRGIYKPISAAWHYYHDFLGDEQTAYNIAMSFVNSRGEYAYE